MITVDRWTVNAPGFTPDTFDQGVNRGNLEGLELRRDPRLKGPAVRVINPTTGGSYIVTRHSCTCKAGQAGYHCKHRAFAIWMLDIMRRGEGDPTA